jgi:large subunit ribosomal protein L13|uniref:50S ribosomal protein L13 n=2 Tax=Cyanidioschyzon merolae TaxID=45157 RepID=Q85FU2_CYAM1|nr:ribosomal protein L13 [Cyanidioschyzon merolae strain 10D]QFV17215.1 50S ribosomal protein L13 [Cyanidioschyzon merolae]BAC76253.1 50S ribosomal protein L13 [Cyanidioschyzon merolae strain 10D]
MLINAKDEILGRLASRVVKTLLTQSVTCIEIVQANQIQVTGNKYKNKSYRRHSGRPGGMKIRYFYQIGGKRALEHAIKGMLPKGVKGRQLWRKIRIEA